MLPQEPSPSEAALVESRLRLALDSASLGTFEYDIASDRVVHDDRTRDILDLPTNVTIADVLARVHPEDQASVDALLLGVRAAGGRAHEFEVRIPTSEGVRYVAASALAVLGTDEDVVRVIGTVRDVTERHREEAASRESVARYRALFESVDVGFCILDMVYDAGGEPIDYRVVETNPAFADQTGMEDADGKLASELAPGISKQWAQTYADIAETGIPRRFEQNIPEVGREFDVHATRVGGPESHRLAVLFADVTEQRASEQALRESEARFRETFENAAVGIAHVGLDGQALLANARLSEIIGYSREEVLALSFQEITHPEDLGADVEQFERVLAGEIPHYQIEKRYRHKNGEWVWANLTVAPSLGPDGAAEYIISVVEDISDKKAAEHALLMLNDELEAHVQARTAELARSNAELDQFAYVASHDLKAPIRAIDSLATWIADDSGPNLSDESARHLALLRGRAARMEGLLDGLLAYSRVGRSDAAPEVLDVGELVADAVALVAPPEGIAVEVQGTLPTVTASPAPLGLVFRNLIGNAIKHHDRPDGRVTISARTRGPWAEFAVEDDGPGIAPEYRERVFQMFQTLRPRDEVEGSGMGLALVKKTVDGQGGRVWVEPSDGRGATFRFTWPLVTFRES